MHVYMRSPVLSVCTANSHKSPVTGCNCSRLAATVDHNLQVLKGIHLKRKLKYTEKAGLVASWLLDYNQYIRQYYSECYNRDIYMYNLKIKS